MAAGSRQWMLPCTIISITTQGVFENVIHASENAADAEREIKLWFEPDEFTERELYPTKVVTREANARVWA